jgi:DNA-binding transcriptional ArsR family regulator
MVVKVTSSPFGGQTRTRVLLALRLLGDTYPRELSRLLETSLSGVQKALRSLEMDGLVAGRSVGRTRVYQLNPRYFAADALAAYLARVAEPESRLRERSAALRRRPRRAGKPL